MKSFVREKRIVAGDYMEVSLYIRTEEQEKACKNTRKRKKYLTRPSNKNWNDKKSKKYAKLLIYANFKKDDYYLTLTYNDEHLPNDLEQVKKHQENFLRKVKRLYKKQGKELKYMWFTSYQFNEEGEQVKRIHHHVLLNGVVDRTEIEECWSRGKGKNKKQLGRTNCKRIQPSKTNELNELANYLTNQEKYEQGRWKKGEKRWSASKNLIKPYETKNDNKYSQRKLAEIAKAGDEDYLLKHYEKYRIIGEMKVKYIEKSGWYINVELIKKEMSINDYIGDVKRL